MSADESSTVDRMFEVRVPSGKSVFALAWRVEVAADGRLDMFDIMDQLVGSFTAGSWVYFGRFKRNIVVKASPDDLAAEGKA